MYASLTRRALANLVPPKIATPSSVSGGPTSSLAPLVEFYSKLPKGPAPAQSVVRGPQAWLFDVKNAAAYPVLVIIATLFGAGYTLDYHMHLKHHKNHPH